MGQGQFGPVRHPAALPVQSRHRTRQLVTPLPPRHAASGAAVQEAPHGRRGTLSASSRVPSEMTFTPAAPSGYCAAGRS
ncbi:hypothetical protein SAV14893_083910 [Streptomyces avermitilis]|uniref:Uncharacterized protein n=1 Tax=Streptomyces avermitilis TaxID=33903 RepID=A0A4D4MFA6_STRAX|nr:hypothetical protein SAVMC3_01050 [Streptomyces avermitilis]GDY68998.1 hypothetical protein SAV14893_083910 [Streptomyces avermitilis]GDY70620.1 hypothetical protein SAV31267_001050 [Streptomyces avermitilis]